MSQKDPWDKAAIVGSILTPILVLFLGLYIQGSLPNNDQAASLAAEILMSNPNSQSVGLRSWALDVLEKSSKIPIPVQVRKELAQHPLSAQALQFDETEVRFRIHCGGQTPLCQESFRTTFEIEKKTNRTRKEVRVRVLLNDDQCQPIRLHVFLNGKKVFESDKLGWGLASDDLAGRPLSTPLISLPPAVEGTNELSIQAEGFPAECSPEGYLKQWGGTLLLLTSKEEDTDAP